MNSSVGRLTMIVLLILLSLARAIAEERTAKEQPPQTNERVDFDNALKANTVKSLSMFIKQHPESELALNAVEEIWQILLAQFPSDMYNYSTSLNSLKTDLPSAIKANRYFLVAFSPKVVPNPGNSRWFVTTDFRELAGREVYLSRISPSIRKPNGEIWGIKGGGAYDIPGGWVPIRPYGEGTHTWDCWCDFAGSSVTLDYHGVVRSYTTLSK